MARQANSASDDNDADSDEDLSASKPALVKTYFPEWCASYFAQSVMKVGRNKKSFHEFEFELHGVRS